MPKLEAKEVRRRMRVGGHTIRALAARMNITMTRVRHVRAHGVTGVALVTDWLEWTR